MSHVPARLPNPDPTAPAERWIGLSERISACGRLLRSCLARYAAHRQLGEAQLSLLWACLAAPASGLNQSEMADLLAVSPPHISGIIEPLRRKGLLKRHWGASDRRLRFWRLTPAGRGLLDCILGDAAGWAHQLDGAMGADRAASLASLLDHLASMLHGSDSSIRPARASLRRFDPAAEEATGNEATGKDVSPALPGRQGGVP